MTFYSKVAPKVEAPVTRLFNGSWEVRGAVQRGPETRTRKQLLNNVEYYATKIPEVAKFKDQLKNLNYVDLVSDICELASNGEVLSQAAALSLTKKQNGVSVLDRLIPQIIKADKQNPHALAFAKEVINNTDTLTSKYFLNAASGGILTDTKVANQFNATRPIVRTIAESTLTGFPSLDFRPQKRFMNIVETFIHPEVNHLRISSLGKLLEKIDSLPRANTYSVDIDKFMNLLTPTARINRNIESLPTVETALARLGKQVDPVDYVSGATVKVEPLS